MEAKGIRLQGELGISRQTIAQGMPECSSCTCMLVCALPCAHCTRDRGCSKHPAFPAPSVLRERNFSKARTQFVSRERETVSTVIASAAKQSMVPQKRRMDCFAALADDANCHRPRRRTIQYPRDVSNEIDRPQRTGYPAFAGYDDFVRCRNDVDRSGSRTTTTPALPPRSYPRR